MKARIAAGVLVCLFSACTRGGGSAALSELTPVDVMAREVQLDLSPTGRPPTSSNATPACDPNDQSSYPNAWVEFAADSDRDVLDTYRRRLEPLGWSTTDEFVTNLGDRVLNMEKSFPGWRGRFRVVVSSQHVEASVSELRS